MNGTAVKSHPLSVTRKHTTRPESWDGRPDPHKAALLKTSKLGASELVRLLADQITVEPLDFARDRRGGLSMPSSVPTWPVGVQAALPDGSNRVIQTPYTFSLPAALPGPVGRRLVGCGWWPEGGSCPGRSAHRPCVPAPPPSWPRPCPCPCPRPCPPPWGSPARPWRGRRPGPAGPRPPGRRCPAGGRR